MKFTLATKLEKDSRMLRDAFKNTLDELMEKDENVCYLDADLMGCLGTASLASKYPDRIINCGIAEANMIGVAAGMANVGKIPYVHSFGPFATRRTMDQVFMSLAYAKLSAKIYGSDPGVCAAFNGGTHMPFEDMATMMAIPKMVCIDSTDYAMTAEVTRKIKNIDDTPVYVRLVRKEAVKIYEDDLDIEIGKGIVLKEGTDVTIIASGIMVAEALKACDTLKSEGISAKVIDMFTWKPIDEELIIKSAKETGAIVTCENHNTLCGLGSAVANVVTANVPVPMEKVGVHDEFGQVGPENFLREEYNLTAEEIVKATKKVISRK
ncbi:MAG: transketolase C-terminal domain-containing protein [Clostridia bacterium]